MPKRSERIPEVLSAGEIARLLARMDGTYKLLASSLYGSGLRPMEAMRLRVKGVYLDDRQVVVRDGMGARDRVTPLPGSIETALEA